jgi:hypothetical protein
MLTPLQKRRCLRLPGTVMLPIAITDAASPILLFRRRIDDTIKHASMIITKLHSTTIVTIASMPRNKFPFA